MSPVIIYRIAHYLYVKNIPFLPIFLTFLIRLIFSCYVPHSVVIGKKLVLGYGGLGIVIHDRCKIGDFCHIDQNVTLGGTSKKYAVPILGNNVYVGAGAKLIGPITIGDNVVVGANAVVVTNIPSNSLVVGIPGKVIKTGIKMADYV